MTSIFPEKCVTALCSPEENSTLRLRLNIPCCSPCTDPPYRACFDHYAKDGFDGRGADIGENFANLGFG